MVNMTAILVCVGLLCAAAMGQGPDGNLTQPQVVAKGGNEFAFDLYAKLAAAEKGNLFFSPSSIHAALGMTYVGAAGSTADQMAKTLHYDSNLSKDQLASAFGEFLKVLNKPGTAPVMAEGGKMEQKPAYQLVVSNALWPMKGYPFKPAFVDLVKKDFGATLEEQDFVKDPDGSRKAINDAVAAQTKDKIKDLVPAGAITPMTRLVLTNAIYFKSNWRDKFEKSATQDAPFKLSADKNVTCPMMKHEEHCSYFESNDLQVLEMPYMSGELSMFVLLPRKVDGLTELEKKLTAENVSKWLDQCKRTMVKVSFPRFKTTGQFALVPTLKEMGITDAFSDKADFSGMATAEKLLISDVIHKSFVAVDEEGTEAAAATAVAISAMAMPVREEPKVFNADHPFAYLIRHNGTGAVLFLGRLTKPGE